jgi:hypothetical protein
MELIENYWIGSLILYRLGSLENREKKPGLGREGQLFLVMPLCDLAYSLLLRLFLVTSLNAAARLWILVRFEVGRGPTY